MSEVVNEVKRQRRMQKAGDVADLSLAVIERFLKDDSEDELTVRALARIKYASTMISAFAKLEQTNGARQALSFAMARELSDNPEEFRRYVTVSMPEHPMTKVLPSGEKQAS